MLSSSYRGGPPRGADCEPLFRGADARTLAPTFSEEALTRTLPAIGAMMMGMMMPASRMIEGGGARERALIRR